MDKRYRDDDRPRIEIVTFRDDGTPDQRIATVHDCDINPTQEHADTVVANARLLCAAPELLSALYAARAELLADVEHFPESEAPETHAALAKVQAAISKAEGTP